MSEARRELRVGKLSFPVFETGDGRLKTRWKDGSTWKSITAVSEERLLKKLTPLVSRILSGELDAARMEGGDHRAYLAAVEALRPYGISVDVAAREYAAARELAGEAGVLEAVRFYRRHIAADLREITVSELTVQFLAAKEAEGASHQYREQIRKDLTRFALAFGPRLISEIRAPEIVDWLATCGHRGKDGVLKTPGPARRNQIRNTVVTLFRFARDRHHLVQDRQTQAEAVPKFKHSRGGIEILSPKELQLVLELVSQLDRDWLPYLALGALAGIRAETLRRLEWSAIRWDSGVVEVPASKSKINRRYLPPFGPALAAWLADWRRARGPITPGSNPRYLLERIVRRAGWDHWPKNTLRKSFISYRLAILKSAEAVALEANNSPAEIFENYREVCTAGGEPVTEDLAKKYFGVMPAEAGKVVQMHL